jgi:hypothetical protein
MTQPPPPPGFDPPPPGFDPQQAHPSPVQPPSAPWATPLGQPPSPGFGGPVPDLSQAPGHSWVPPQPPSARPIWPWVLVAAPMTWALAIGGVLMSLSASGAGLWLGLAPLIVGLALLGSPSTRPAGKGLAIGGLIGVATIAMLAGTCLLMLGGLG